VFNNKKKRKQIDNNRTGERKVRGADDKKDLGVHNAFIFTDCCSVPVTQDIRRRRNKLMSTIPKRASATRPQVRAVKGMGSREETRK
jgi:hypothetical protein